MLLRVLVVILVASQPGGSTEVGPWWITEPWSVLLISNSTGGQVDCKAGGEPTPSATWRFADGKPLSVTPGLIEVLENGTLRFLPFHPSAYRHDVHAAAYRCIARNTAGAIVSRDVRVKAVVLQYLELKVDAAQTYHRGNTAVLKCIVPSFMKEFISITSWLQDSSFNIYPSPKGDGKYHMLPTGELLVRRLEDTDMYRGYQCRAINRLTGQTLLSLHRVRFLITDSLAQEAPKIQDTPSTIHTKKDQTVVLPCFAQGNPPPTYTWMKSLAGGGEIEVMPGGRVETSGEVLILERVEMSDMGVWTCIANNSMGSHKNSITLHVAVPLSVSLHPSGQVMVDVGDYFELKCVVTGGQHPSVTWLKDTNLIMASGAGNILSIQKVGREDAGMYQCLVKDEEGSLQAAVQLILGAAQPQLLYRFIQQTVQPGPAMSLKCIAAGNPTPHITWTLDGFSLPTNNERFVIGQYVTIHGDVISHVNISNVHVQDGGIYQCRASNRVGEVSHSAAMRVYGLPHIRPMPNISAVAGEPLYLACPVAGYPIENIIWAKEGKKLPTSRRQRVFNNGTLYIANVEREQDQGTYRCSAQNKQGKSASQEVSIAVIVPPKLGPFTFGELIEGVRTQVQCVVQAGDPPLTIQWLKDDLKITSDLGIQISNDDYSSTLAIGRVGSEHAGQYTCLASNPAKSTKLTSSLIVSVPPKWRVEPKDVNITKEGVAMFECVAEGFPNPTTTWKKVIGQSPSEYQDLDVGRLGYMIFENGTFIIKPALPEHQGQYLCEASNGIGSGISSTVSLVVNNPPDFEMTSSQESVRRGQAQILVCEAKGDHPMSIVWSKYSSSQLNSRYEVREKDTLTGMISELMIENSVKPDSGQYACTATNPYGTAQRTISLQVQDAPSKPIDVRVAEIGSRSLKVSWVPPPDEQISKLSYNVHYKRGSGVIIEGWESVAAGSETHVTLNHLHPSTVYSIKVQAENQLGAGEPSDIIQVTTSMEAPSGEPQGLTVSTKSSTELTVSWLPPPQHTHNGDLIGYHVGFRELNNGPSSYFNFTSVNASPNGDTLILGGLSPYRKYGVVVQAFNNKGAGPMSAEFISHTSEDVPAAPPMNIQCVSQSSESILMSWKPPPTLLQNGRIKGYRLYYENQAEYPPGFVEAETRSTSELSLNLHGLQKYSNYSIQVWGFTKVGDGEKSDPIFCMTDEDVPEAPDGIKVLSTSMSSLTVSWLPPAKPNGRIIAYFIYWKPLEGGKDRDPEKKRVSAVSTHHQISQLSKAGTYELWVAAATKAGEGKNTHVVYATPSNRGAAGIISFGGTINAMVGTPVTMPCLITGNPAPNRVWSPKPLPQNTQALPDGSLYIPSIQRVHQRNYSCLALNPPASDEITYVLQVTVPPEQPTLMASETGSDWIEIHWSVADNGGSAIRGYILEYVMFSADSPPWVEITIPRDKTSYRLNNLNCGRQYHLKIAAFNAAGVGMPSLLLTTQTEGGRPIKPGYSDFLSGNMSSVVLNLNAWNANSCPILGFNIEYKEVGHSDWLVVGKNVEGKEKFDIVGLWPGRKYKIRVVADNSAGLTAGEYTFTTLPNLGVTLSPTSIKISSEGDSPYLEPNIILPIIASILTLVSIGAAITICFRRKREMTSRNCGGRQRHHSETQGMVTMDNKSNLAQREQFYAAMHKGMATPLHDLQCENIPEYPDDISPYATFHVATQQVNTPQHIHNFVYHDQALAAMETMPLKSANTRNDDYSKLRGGSKSSKCLSAGSDYSGSTDQWSEQGMMPRPERIQLHMYSSNSVRGDSSSSPDNSPIHERRLPVRHKHNPRKEESSTFGYPRMLQPPTGFTDGHEISEAECDMEPIHRLKPKTKGFRNKRDRRSRFTIAV